jgi:hypothetical protein
MLLIHLVCIVIPLSFVPQCKCGCLSRTFMLLNLDIFMKSAISTNCKAGCNLNEKLK